MTRSEHAQLTKVLQYLEEGAALLAKARLNRVLATADAEFAAEDRHNDFAELDATRPSNFHVAAE